MFLDIDTIYVASTTHKSLRTGIAYQKFLEFIGVQKGDLTKLGVSSNVKEIKTDKSGYINNIHALKIAELALKLGSGRTSKEDVIDMGVGVQITKNIGDFVNIGDTIAKVYVGNKEINYSEVLTAFEIDDVKKEKEPIIYGIIK